MVGLNTFFLIVGLALFILGLLFRQGYFRAGYWMQPFGYYRSAVYGLIPIGMAMIIIGIGPPFYDTIWIKPLRVLVLFLGLLGIFMWLFEPRFAKPDWINWLEDNHYDILPELRQEMYRMTGQERKEIIQNQDSLEAWITEFRQNRYR